MITLPPRATVLVRMAVAAAKVVATVPRKAKVLPNANGNGKAR